jgi:hypothetical protein
MQTRFFSETPTNRLPERLPVANCNVLIAIFRGLQILCKNKVEQVEPPKANQNIAEFKQNIHYFMTKPGCTFGQNTES